MIKFLKLFLRAVLTIFLFIFVILVFVIAYVQVRYDHKIYKNVGEVPERKYAIVLGAGVLANGNPSQVLEDRIVTAVSLYKGRKVENILFTGDGSSDDNYDETAIMKNHAIKLGVRQEDIFTDNKGVRTIKSCERAKTVFGINEAIVVTQNFHLSRALYLCNSMGIDSIGVVADKNVYFKIRDYQIREIPASLIAFWEANFGIFTAPRVESFQKIFSGLF